MSDSPRIPDYYQSTVDSSGHCQGDCDANGLPLNGRLKSVTLVTNDPNEATGYTTSYAYNLATNTTTVTYPADSNNQVGTATMVYDSMGDLLSSTDPPPLALLLRQEARWIGVGFGTGLLGAVLTGYVLQRSSTTQARSPFRYWLLLFHYWQLLRWLL